MDYKILGPLEVWHDDDTMVINGRQARKLLAALALHAGQVVTVSRLVDILWDDAPPQTARRQVQNAMAAVRRRLPDPSSIEITGNGYQLRLDRSTVDARIFDEMISTARQASPTDALPLLNHALDMWRGEPLEGLSGRFFEAAAKRLNESRLAAIENRVDLGFESGNHSHLVDELRELVEQHPFRQRFAAQLMEALHRRGQTREALMVYADLQARLSNTLGLDPDEQVRKLHAKIVSTRSEPSAARTAHPTPAQLPADTATFTGRTAELDALDRMLDIGERTAVVTAIAGMGGVGKTALAVHWAHRVRRRFPDGQLYINLRGYDPGESVTPLDALGRFLIALGRSGPSIPDNVDDAAALYRSLLADRRMLVIIDNAHEAADVRPLLPDGTGNFTLVTSRDRLARLTELDGATPVRLETLSHGESVTLLTNIIGTDRAQAEAEAVRLLAGLCGHLPLALRIAAAQIASRPTLTIAEFVAQLDGADRLSRLSIDGEARATITAIFDCSYRVLDDRSQQLLLRLAQIPGPYFSHELAVHLSELDEHDAAKALARLLSAHLVEGHQENRYRFHDLVREYLHAQSLQDIDRPARLRVQSRFIEWYDRLNFALPTDEGTNVIAAFTAWEHHPQVWKLANVARTFWYKGYSPNMLLGLCDRALASARQSSDAEAVPRIYTAIASLYRGLGKHVEAVKYGREALASVEQTPSGDWTGRYRCNLAIYVDELGNLGESVSLLRQALKSATQAKRQDVMINCAAALGNAYRILGEFAEAEHFLRMAVGLVDPETVKHDVNVPRMQLGVLFLAMGRLDDALAEINYTIDTADRNSGVRYQVLARIRRAAIARERGDYEDAYRCLDKAIELSTLNGHDNLLAEAQVQLAELLNETGRPADALKQLNALPHHGSDEPDKGRRAEVARIHGLIDLSAGRSAQAVDHLSSAHDLYASMPSPLMRARTLAALGDAREDSGDHARARRCRRQALEIFTRLGVPDAQKVWAALEPASPRSAS